MVDLYYRIKSYLIIINGINLIINPGLKAVTRGVTLSPPYEKLRPRSLEIIAGLTSQEKNRGPIEKVFHGEIVYLHAYVCWVFGSD
jgi:hypothetical protein